MSDQRTRLSLLDFSRINADQSPLEVLQDTVAIGQRAATLHQPRATG